MASRAEIVGQIAIEVTADPKGFAAKLTAAMKAAAAKASKSNAFKPLLDDAEKAASKTGKKFGETFEREVVKVTNRRRGGGLFSRIFGGPGGSSKTASEAKGLAKGFGSLLESMVGLIPGGEGVIKMFTSMGFTAIPASISALTVMIAVFVSLAVEIAALIGWLVQLIGILNVLPAALAIVLAVIAPLVIAFQGLGGAIAALASGDVKKINAELKKLTPSARSFLREAYMLKSAFKGIKSSVQEAFFGAIKKGDLTKTFAYIGPALRRGLAKVSGTLGGLVDRALKALADPKVAAGITAIFDTTSQILVALSGPLGSFFTAFGKSIIAALPAMTKLAGIFGKFIDKFATWIIDGIESGKFEKWIDKALVTFGELNDLVASIVEWFKVLFADLDGDGESTIKTITEQFRKWTEMLKDPGSKNALKGLILLFDAMGISILGALTVLGMVAGAIGTVIYYLQQAYHWFLKLLGIEEKGNIHRKAEDVVDSAGRRTIGTAFQKIPKPFATGGVVTSPTAATVAEAGPEAIVPLTNPARAAQVMNEAGLTGMMYSGGGGPNIRVFLGTREITDILKVVVDRKLDKVASGVNAGTREA